MLYSAHHTSIQYKCTEYSSNRVIEGSSLESILLSLEDLKMVTWYRTSCTKKVLHFVSAIPILRRMSNASLKTDAASFGRIEDSGITIVYVLLLHHCNQEGVDT